MLQRILVSRIKKVTKTPSVFANHDIKYEVNKLRAQTYAQQQKEGIISCPDKDTPSTEAFCVRPDYPAQKVLPAPIQWILGNLQDTPFTYLCAVM